MVTDHPFHRHRFVTWIAKMKWTKLALVFVCLVVSAAVVLGVARSLFYPDQFYRHVGEEIAKYLMILIDVRDANEPDNMGLLAVLFAIGAGLTKLILIVGLLGSVVFKFLIVPDVFQARKKMSVTLADDGTPQLTLRIYNATLLEIVDIEFFAYTRVPKGKYGGRSVPNKKVAIAEGRDKWPIAIPFVPYSIHIPLYPSDIDPSGRYLRSIRNELITPLPVGAEGASFLVLIVCGKRPELGTDIVETHWFGLSGATPDYEFGNFEEIHVVPSDEPKRYGGTPSDWDGWDRFEMQQASFDANERAFIFGYGSLVNRTNLERFLSARNLQLKGFQYATLKGFHRGWNVAMDNSVTIPGYKFYEDRASGKRAAGFVSFLNIYRKPGCSVNGAIFEVPGGALAEFDRRERNYDRIDVTAAFDGKPNGRIWAYVAKEAGLERYANGLHNGTAMIDEYYRNEVEQAFSSLGNEAYRTYVDTTDAPNVPVLDLKIIAIPSDS